MADISALRSKMGQENFLFKIIGLAGGEVCAMMLNDLVISGSNSFNSAGDMVREGAGGVAGIGDRVMAKGADLINNKLLGRQLAGYGKYNKSETRSKWTDSSKPQFTVEFVLLADNASDAIVNAGVIQSIKSGTLPIREGGALLAPLGYRGFGATGTLTFILGKWFVAPKLLIVNESCKPSKQVMSNGYPLFWECSITLETFEMLTIDEFQRYFQPVPVTPAKNGKLGIPSSSKGVESILKQKLPTLSKLGRR